MPEMDGLEMMLDLTRNFLNIKVIAISGGLEGEAPLNVAKLLGARQTDVSKALGYGKITQCRELRIGALVGRMTAHRHEPVLRTSHNKYKRTIGDVILPEGINVNHMLVKEGWCGWYRKYAPGEACGLIHSLCCRGSGGRGNNVSRQRFLQYSV